MAVFEVTGCSRLQYIFTTDDDNNIIVHWKVEAFGILRY